MKEYSLAVVFGRFQIPHAAHLALLQFARSLADEVLVVIGSINHPRTVKDPFSYVERSEMLMAALDYPSDVRVRGLEDRRYNDQQWTRNARALIASAQPRGRVAIVGHHKDHSSYYLDMFPEYALVEFQGVADLASSDIRDELFRSGQVPAGLPEPVREFLQRFRDSEHFQALAEEFAFLRKYRESWSSAPYPPIFLTVDALVIASGHVLMVRRRANPGKGLLALPGGFVGQDERVEEAMLRELREETRLKLPVPVLRGNIRQRELFDDPQRSLRGRTVTVAYLIELPAGPLPRVKGADDAEKALWVPLNEIFNARFEVFEDHLDIIHKMTGGI
jgi:bifunctional NMN adenylyltransferase/nudix hydrolase